MKIKTILVSQPEPQNDKNPYADLAERNNLKVDFRPFIHVEGVPAKEFRKERIDILAHSAVIFTSRTAVDNYFRMAEELRLTIPD
jgi:uroporphyrinogen-III synthase